MFLNQIDKNTNWLFANLMSCLLILCKALSSLSTNLRVDRGTTTMRDNLDNTSSLELAHFMALYVLSSVIKHIGRGRWLFWNYIFFHITCWGMNGFLRDVAGGRVTFGFVALYSLNSSFTTFVKQKLVDIHLTVWSLAVWKFLQSLPLP